MGSRSSHLRTKVVALLVSLAALWAFAAWVTLRDGLNLLWVQTYDTQISQPVEPLLTELQVERRLSVVYLAKPGSQQREALEANRRRTEALAAAFKKSAQGWQARLAGSAELNQRIDELSAGLDRLPETRASIDSRTIDRATAAQEFTKVLDGIFRVFDSLGRLDEAQIADDTATLIQLNRVRELVSQEDALVAGALAAGKLSSPEYAQFVQLVGAQRFLSREAAARLPDDDRRRFDQMSDGAAFSRFEALEDRIVTNGRTSTTLPVSAVDWRNATEPALSGLADVVQAGGDAVIARATPVAAWVIVRMVLAAGLGLLAVIASIVVSITTARALVQQLERLRQAAWQLAEERLPGVVERLGRGEEVDVESEAPPLAFGTDEIGQVGEAFNAVQETAIRTAVRQAELRRSVRDIFLSLARRTQALVHRQLTLLDAMERRETDPEELEDLFRVDHLATRMRRNAENLIVLSGSTPGRSWRRNVPMVDVVRGAVAEVEDYTRVTVLPIGPVALAGRAVGDVIHLLAELIENALSFSPPHTGVEVKGQIVANGYAIEIEDRGLGMSEEDLAAANERIASGQEFNLANAARLGLYVVSRLTERHGVRVQLKESPYGGTTAVVLIPLDLITEGDATDEEQSPAAITGGGGRRPDSPAPSGQLTPAAVSPVAVVEAPAAPAVSAALDGPTQALPIRQPGQRRQSRPVSEEPAAPAVPTPGEPATAPVAARQPASLTPAGLPVRVRQANLTPALRETEEPATAAESPVVDETARPPEKIRRMMSSYQSGTRRGRTDAARLLGEEPESGADLAGSTTGPTGDHPVRTPAPDAPTPATPAADPTPVGDPPAAAVEPSPSGDDTPPGTSR